LQGVLGQTRMAIVMDGEAIVSVITKIDLIEYLARGRGRGGGGSIVPPRV
jgi:hypothetical protein